MVQTGYLRGNVECRIEGRKKEKEKGKLHDMTWPS